MKSLDVKYRQSAKRQKSAASRKILARKKNSRSYDAFIIAAILVSSALMYYLLASLPPPTNDDMYYMGIAYSLISGGPILRAYPFFVSFGIVFPLAMLYKLFGFSMYI
ncbi:MAG: hypothetical protein ACP5MK_03830 [Candidatus Micrarchaeia archaeon]